LAKLKLSSKCFNYCIIIIHESYCWVYAHCTQLLSEIMLPILYYWRLWWTIVIKNWILLKLLCVLSMLARIKDIWSERGIAQISLRSCQKCLGDASVYLTEQISKLNFLFLNFSYKWSWYRTKPLHLWT